jgi:DNA-binding beta-propeller fold protein YncE
VSTLFVTDYGASAIVRFDGATGERIDVFAELDRPASVQVSPDGELYAAGFGRGEVARFDLATGAPLGVFFYDTTVLEEPMQLLWRGDELYVLGNDTQNTVVIDPAGRMMRELGYPTMRGAQDFAVAETGELFVATESHPELGSAVQVWDTATGTLLRHFGGRAELAFASGLAFADGVLYVSDFERGTVTCFDPATGRSLGVLVEGLHAPARLHLGPDGALYVLDATGLLRFDPTSGAPLGTLVDVGQGGLRRPLSFTFVPGMVPEARALH